MLDVLFYGPIYSCSGYARIRHLLVELTKNNVKVRTKPFGFSDDVNYIDYELLRGLENTKISSPYIALSTGIPLQFKKDPEAIYNIGYTMFETDALPKPWVKFCNEMDEIWVPSESNLNSFSIANINNIKLIPYGINLDLFERKCIKKSEYFTFLSIGTCIDRKGWDILLKAYIEEFSEKENVKLLIKFDGTNSYADREIKMNISKFRKNDIPKISICNAKVDDKMMVDFYSVSDCFVLPTRGEAFGLPMLESLACEVPVITSDNGGYLDFLNEKNSWFIRSNGLNQISSRLGKINPYYRNLWFNEPDVNHLKELMRNAFENKTEYNEKKKHTTENLERFSYKNIAKVVLSRLKEIEDEI